MQLLLKRLQIAETLNCLYDAPPPPLWPMLASNTFEFQLWITVNKKKNTSQQPCLMICKLLVFKRSFCINAWLIELCLVFEETDTDDTDDNPTDNQYSSISDLLLWAIFANRKELAEICWLRGTDHLSKYRVRIWVYIVNFYLLWMVHSSVYVK